MSNPLGKINLLNWINIGWNARAAFIPGMAKATTAQETHTFSKTGSNPSFSFPSAASEPFLFHLGSEESKQGSYESEY